MKRKGLLFLVPEERPDVFRAIDEHFPTRLIEAGDDPFPLGENLLDMSGLTYEVEGQSFRLEQFLDMRAHHGLIVVKGGDVLFEHYGNGNDEHTRWISFSVTKSITSMLIGAAIRDGYILSVHEPVSHYLPRFRGTPYERATIENVLNMASGVAWNEDYADPRSDVAQAGSANGIRLVQYLAKLPKAAEPGEVFNYSTGEINLAGEILRAAIGNNAATYLTHRVWKPFGMGADATWMTYGEGGGETGGCCISATLRDLARLGLFAMRGGMLRDGTRVLPDDWMAKSTTPSKGSEEYGYLWWLKDDGSYAARGVFGQLIFIDPKAGLVIAAHSNAVTAVESTYAKHLDALTQALRRLVSAPE